MTSFIINAQTIADYTVYYEFKCIADTIKNEVLPPQEFMLFRVGQESRFITGTHYYNDSIGAVFEKEYPQPDFKSQKEMRFQL